MTPTVKPHFAIQHRNLDDTADYQKLLSIDDLRLYFLDTFVYLTSEHKWEHIRDFQSSISGTPLVNFGNGKLSSAFSQQPIYFVFPDVGLYNYKQGVVSFYRKNLRQNKKALCSYTGEIYSSVNWFTPFMEISYGFVLSQAWRWTLRNVNKTFRSTAYFDFAQAHKKIKSLHALSRALSLEFCLGQGIVTKAPSLWFHHTLVGHCPTNNKIVVTNSALLQEIVDYFMPQGLHIDTSN